MTWKRGIVLQRFCLNVEISVMMINHQNQLNTQRDFKDNEQQTQTERVEIGRTLKKSAGFEKEITSKCTTISPFSNLILDHETLLFKIESSDSCWNAAYCENN